MASKKDNTPADILSEGLMSAIPEEYLNVMGRVVTQWSILEVIMEALCWQAGGIRNDIGRIFTSQMQMQGKLDLLQALLVQKKPKLAERFKPVSEYIRECLLGQRNLVVHGHWAIVPNTTVALAVKYSARGKLVSQSKVYTTKQLLKLANDIADVSVWMLKLWQKLPALKQTRGGIGHDTPDTLLPLDYTNRKKLALLPLTSPLKRQPTQAQLKAAKQRRKLLLDKKSQR